MNFIVKFFHQLMNPHCEHCKDEEDVKIEESKYCSTCEVLKIQLATANLQVSRLTDNLMNGNKQEEAPVDNSNRQIIQTRHVPFSVIRQKLERDSRKEAARLNEEALAKAAKPDSELNPGQVPESIVNLEKDLGITNAGNTAETVNS